MHPERGILKENQYPRQENKWNLSLVHANERVVGIRANANFLFLL